MNNTGISLTEACKTAYSELSDQQKASCPGIVNTGYLQWAAVPVVVVIVLAVVCVVVFSRKRSGS